MTDGLGLTRGRRWTCNGHRRRTPPVRRLFLLVRRVADVGAAAGRRTQANGDSPGQQTRAEGRGGRETSAASWRRERLTGGGIGSPSLRNSQLMMYDKCV